METGREPTNYISAAVETTRDESAPRRQGETPCYKTTLPLAALSRLISGLGVITAFPFFTRAEH